MATPIPYTDDTFGTVDVFEVCDQRLWEKGCLVWENHDGKRYFIDEVKDRDNGQYTLISGDWFMPCTIDTLLEYQDAKHDISYDQVERLRADLAAAHTMLADARAQVAERDARLAVIVATTQHVVAAMGLIDPATMEASSGVRKLFIQARLALQLIEVNAKAESDDQPTAG